MKLYGIILSLLLQGCLLAPCVKASEADLKWQEAVRSARHGEDDFAFMDFQAIAQDSPDSCWSLPAAFAVGEYYFLQDNLNMASDAFESFYAKYPRHEEALIALAYLFKIAQSQKNTNAIKEYHHRVASFQQLSFVFKENKTFMFLSGFGHKHKLVFYIDKIELYVDDKLFTQVRF